MTALGISAAMLAAATTAAADPPPPSDVTQTADGDLVAPDVNTALEAAGQTGEQVLVAEETSSNQAVYANPDGGMSVELTPAPTRVEDPDSPSGWSDIDLGLVARDGGFGPKVSPAAVVFSAGGSAPFAKLTGDGWSIAYTWPTPLPTPIITGASATYVSVLPDTDLVVEATLGGFSKRLVVHSAPEAPLSFHIGLVTSGVTISSTAAGLFQAVDGAGNARAQIGGAWMWDASGDPDDAGASHAGAVGAALDAAGCRARS